MSTTYRQISSFEENGYGAVTIVTVVSDTYDGLYATSGWIETGVLDLDDSQEDVDVDAGVQVENRQKVYLPESAIESQGDVDAIAFILAARDKTVRRFIAVHINPADPDSLTPDSLDFSGVFLPDVRWEDIQWHGSEYSPVQTPVRRWEMDAQNFFEGIFDQVKLEHLISGNGAPGDPEYSPGIDASWEDGIEPFIASPLYKRVDNRLGYFDDGQDHARWIALVSLNLLLRKLADNLIAALVDRGLGTYGINLIDSPIGVTLSPARFVDSGVLSGWRYSGMPYLIKSADALEPHLGDTFYPRQNIYVNYLLAKPDYGNTKQLPEFDHTPPGSNQDDYSFAKRCDTFTDLLYSVAASLGMFVVFEYSGNTTLDVSFVSRKGLRRHEIFVRDAVRSEGNTNPASASDGRSWTARPFGLASEGNASTQGQNYYEYQYVSGYYNISDTTRNASRADGEMVMFSVAPTMRRLLGITGATNIAIPHNMRTYRGTTPRTGEAVDAKGVTTALFVRTNGNGERGYTSSSELHLPAAAIHATVDGIEETFYSLTEYLNAITQRDKTFYETELNIDVPYLCQMRKSEDGSHPDDDNGRGRWQNLQLGCEFTYDGSKYIVIGIRRSRKAPMTKLRLHRQSRTALDTGTLAADVSVSASVPSRPGAAVALHGAAGDIVAGDFVTINTSGDVYKAQAYHTHYGGLYGVALNDASLGDLVDVQLDGIASCAAYDFTPGKSVYVRTAAPAEPNVRSEPLTGTSESTGEDMFVRIGIAVSTTSFKIESPRKVIFTPELPD